VLAGAVVSTWKSSVPMNATGRHDWPWSSLRVTPRFGVPNSADVVGPGWPEANRMSPTTVNPFASKSFPPSGPVTSPAASMRRNPGVGRHEDVSFPWPGGDPVHMRERVRQPHD
jgi:hypothetical protein